MNILLALIAILLVISYVFYRRSDQYKEDAENDKPLFGQPNEAYQSKFWKAQLVWGAIAIIAFGLAHFFGLF